MRQELRERLAELEHDQWVEWSKALAGAEDLSSERLERWKALWCAYSDLPEVVKEADRIWADKVIDVFVELDHFRR